MDGFKRPQRPEQRPTTAIPEQQLPRPVATGTTTEPSFQQPAQATTSTTQESVQKPHRHIRKRWIVLIVTVIVLIAAAVGAYSWFEYNLTPVNSSDTSTKRFAIGDGSTFDAVAKQLKSRGLIRSVWAFDLYARIQGERGDLKASTCSLKSSMPASEILTKLNEGCNDFVSIMFYPGATIEKPIYKPAGSTVDQSKMYIKYVLKNAGYSDSEITTALKKTYNSPLFADKPSGMTLEGYVFGETYYVDKSASAEDVLQETFAQMYSIVQKDDLVSKFKAQGLNLYQGITLASIVQRELNCEDKPTTERKNRCYGYQQTIAQIFLKRLKENIALGSDVTFIYAADMLNVTPSVDLDSPYNTRKYTGLPPGPIASPGELALKAVANPSNTDYLYFIAGDDGLIYFAKDAAGHQQNIDEHCQELCGNAV